MSCATHQGSTREGPTIPRSSSAGRFVGRHRNIVARAGRAPASWKAAGNRGGENTEPAHGPRGRAMRAALAVASASGCGNGKKSYALVVERPGRGRLGGGRMKVAGEAPVFCRASGAPERGSSSSASPPGTHAVQGGGKAGKGEGEGAREGTSRVGRLAGVGRAPQQRGVQLFSGRSSAALLVTRYYSFTAAANRRAPSHGAPFAGLPQTFQREADSRLRGKPPVTESVTPATPSDLSETSLLPGAEGRLGVWPHHASSPGGKDQAALGHAARCGRFSRCTARETSWCSTRARPWRGSRGRQGRRRWRC